MPNLKENVAKILMFIKNIDWFILGPMIFLMIFGLLTMSTLSFSDPIFIKQSIFIVLAIAIFLIASQLDYRELKNSYILLALYGICIVMLVAILLFGHSANGSSRWFTLGPILIAPSEPMKLILILILAKFFARRHLAIARFKNIFLSLIYVAVPALLVFLQPDLSSAIILGVIWFGLLVVSGLSRKHFLWFVGVALVLGLAGWFFFMSPYQKARVLNFVEPTRDLQGTGWNAYQSVIAVGSGGVLGKGIGYGTQSRFGYLPENHTDFIFASFAEEWGLVGGIFVCLLFFIIVYSLCGKATRGHTNFESLFIIGVTIWLAIQVSFNIGMNIGVFPVTGIPLPFMSYGGSHILIESFALGMCVGMSRYGRVAHKSKFKQEFIGLE